MVHRRSGFSLMELLVVVGIIMLLLAILMPALAAARHAARSTVCLSHLQQIGDCYLMYVNANHGHSVPSRQSVTDPSWWELLQQNNKGIPPVMRCPEAAEPVNGVGSATLAWEEATYSVGAPFWTLRSLGTGSYGINEWLAELAPEQEAGASADWLRHLIHLPARKPSETPAFADCITSFGAPRDTDTVPTNLINPRPTGPTSGSQGQMASFCIDRHRLAVNVVFLDGHAQRVPLADLWKLHWNNQFKPTDVSVP